MKTKIQGLIKSKGGNKAFSEWSGVKLRRVQSWANGTNSPCEAHESALFRIVELEGTSKVSLKKGAKDEH